MSTRKSPAKQKKAPSAAARKKPAAAKTARKSAYKPSLDEKYMGKRQLKWFSAYLEEMSEEIAGNMRLTVGHMQQSPEAIPDENDRASKESEFAVELRERDRERQLLEKIGKAKERIKDGTFGYCEECADPIGLKRMMARPVTTMCYECKCLQENMERARQGGGNKDEDDSKNSSGAGRPKSG